MPIQYIKIFCVLLYCAGSLAAQTASAGELLVVVGNNSAVGSLDKTQVRNIFLGRVSSFPGGQTATPVDQPESSPLRDEFYVKVANLSAAEVKARWAQLAFTGRGEPPRVADNSKEIKKILNATPGAIGYIKKSDIDDSVKIVFVVE
ncbi:MAG TPA: phosphate ABC transporter substrate-binding protein [Gallionellaceae bacterium]